MMNTPPNDVRNFVHKRLFSAAKGFVTSGFNPLSAVSGFVSGGGRRSSVQPSQSRMIAEQAAANRRAMTLAARPHVQPRAISRAVVRRPVSRTLTARPDASSAAEKQAGRSVKFAGLSVTRIGTERSVASAFGGDPECRIPFQVWDEVQGKCVFGLGDQPGRDDTPIGDTVMGQYGAGEVPGNHVINRAVCRRGMVLGSDGVCYNKSQITNKERQWPRGRRPLLTGGDMRAISTAARAGRRLERTTKRLQKIGLMKKPAPRRSAAQIHHAK